MTVAVAAFDFDGTITRRDTLAPFLQIAGGRRRVALAALACIPLAADRDAGRRRDRAKGIVLARIFAGRPAAPVEALAAEYADSLPRGYQPEIVERLAHHREQGHRTVLVSASLALYARPAARALGFDDVIAVELERADDATFTGAMVGPNVRGAEKAVRLARLLGAEPTELWAYGNSDGDRELLAMADHPVWVGASRRTGRR